MFKIKKFDFLVALYIFCICASEMLGAKTFSLLTIGSFKLSASVAIFVIPVLFTVNDVIIEVKGKERARSVVRSGLVVIAMIFFFSILATILPPSGRFASSESAYDAIFTKSIRISAASLTAFTLAEFMDIWVFSKLREKLGKSKLWLRNNLSNFISEGIDTIVFMTLAFYALDKGFGDNFSFLIGLIIPYWLLKCFMSIIETPFVYLGVKWLKSEKKEKM
jgi:queuosine precursor transporter